MCGSKPKAKTSTQAVAEPEISPVAQAMIEALSKGPTGYDPAMRANLGMDAPMPGYNGGERPTSGMVNTMPTTPGYTPVQPVADPLKEAMAPGPANPTKIEDLYMKYSPTKIAAENAAAAASLAPAARPVGGSTIYNGGWAGPVMGGKDR